MVAQPTPLSWTTGDAERDGRNWMSELGDRELSHLLGYLNVKGLAAAACTCKRLAKLCAKSQVWKDVVHRLWPPAALRQLELPSRGLGWRRVAREVVSLESLRWRSLACGGCISPLRTNFSTCGLGDRVYVFGGEGVDSTALNDLFVLDLSDSHPAWARVDVQGTLPPGRWGHTLREISSDALLLFGGSGAEGPLGDAHVLRLGGEDGARWHPVVLPPDSPAPSPRSWHGACALSPRQLLVMGGCSLGGRLLSDTWLLTVGDACGLPDQPSSAPHQGWSYWRELSTAWAPPARLGLSLVATEGSRVFAFGGLASAGPIRLRSQDSFVLDLDSSNPTWSYVSGSRHPSGMAAAGTPPPPRLEQVAGTLIGGRVMVFGGSINAVNPAAAAAAAVEAMGGVPSAAALAAAAADTGLGGGESRSWEPYVMSPNSASPTWRRLRVRGEPPRDAWGYSSCMLGYNRFVLLGSYKGNSLDLNQLHELQLITPPELEAYGGGEARDARRAAREAEDPWAPARGSNVNHEHVVVREEDCSLGDSGEDEEEELYLERRRDSPSGWEGEEAPEPMDSDEPRAHAGECGGGGGSAGDDSQEAKPRPARARLCGGEFPSSSDDGGGDESGEGNGGDYKEEGRPPPQFAGRPGAPPELYRRTDRREVSSQAPLEPKAAQDAPAAAPQHPLKSVLGPVAPLLASGARLLTQLLGGGAAAGGSAPPAEQGAEEVDRRRRSLAGRGVAHPRPNRGGSGSDEEPPMKH